MLDDLHARRAGQGWKRIGRKIGFTNRTIWARYGVDRPMWSYVWDRTVTFAPDGNAVLSLSGLMEPRIEPEVAFRLRGPLPPGDDAQDVLRAIEWIAPAFEIVHSVFPGWKFGAADCTAAFGLHGRLVVGPPLLVDDTNRAALAASLPRFTVALLRGDSLVDTGIGENVLGSPALALVHLRDLLATQPFLPAAGGRRDRDDRHADRCLAGLRGGDVDEQVRYARHRRAPGPPRVNAGACNVEPGSAGASTPFPCGAMAMIRCNRIVCIAALTAVAACATPDPQADEAYKAPVYRTGSNLPAGRESGQTAQELTAAERKTIEDLQNRPRQPIGVTK